MIPCGLQGIYSVYAVMLECVSLWCFLVNMKLSLQWLVQSNWNDVCVCVPQSSWLVEEYWFILVWVGVIFGYWKTPCTVINVVWIACSNQVGTGVCYWQKFPVMQKTENSHVYGTDACWMYVHFCMWLFILHSAYCVAGHVVSVHWHSGTHEVTKYKESLLAKLQQFVKSENTYWHDRLPQNKSSTLAGLQIHFQFRVLLIAPGLCDFEYSRFITYHFWVLFFSILMANCTQLPCIKPRF